MPGKANSITIQMVGFVKDAKNQVNTFEHKPQSSIPSLLHEIKEETQLWHGLLWTSESALELTKCLFHVLIWLFHEGILLLQGGTL